MNGNESYEELQRQLSNAKADLEAEQWRRRKCAEENEELRAHCERLCGALQRMVNEAAHLAGFSENTERAVIDALNETPAESLREIRAEAGCDDWISGVKGGLRAFQRHADIFNEHYVQATHTSQPQHWLDAALCGRQLVNTLHSHGVIEDSWETLDIEWKEDTTDE